MFGDILIVKASEEKDFCLKFSEEPPTLLDVEKVSSVKDNSYISDHVYHKIRKDLGLEKFLPTTSEIRKLRNIQNSNQTLLENDYGVFIDIKSKLIRELSIKIESNQLSLFESLIHTVFIFSGKE